MCRLIHAATERNSQQLCRRHFFTWHSSALTCFPLLSAAFLHHQEPKCPNKVANRLTKHLKNAGMVRTTPGGRLRRLINPLSGSVRLKEDKRARETERSLRASNERCGRRPPRVWRLADGVLTRAAPPFQSAGSPPQSRQQTPTTLRYSILWPPVTAAARSGSTLNSREVSWKA